MSLVWELLLMCWNHSRFALFCDGDTLSEAGDCTSTKNRAWWVSSSLSVNCSCPRSPFYPSDLREVSFLCMPPWAIAYPKPRQHQLKNSLPLCAVNKELDITSEILAHVIFLSWAIWRVSLYPGSFLTKSYFLVAFLPGRRNHLPLFIHRLP